MDQARWVTTNSRILRLWISTEKKKLDDDSIHKLGLLVEFIINAYANAWFSIRVNPKWTFGPKIYLNFIRSLQKQDQEVRSAVEKTLQTGAYYCHSEMVLQHMLSEGDEEDRRFAVDMILKIREAEGHPEIGDQTCRKRKNPAINLEATSFHDLIDWSNVKSLFEPVLTTSISSKDLLSFIDHQMEVENWPVHTQVCSYEN